MALAIFSVSIFIAMIVSNITVISSTKSQIIKIDNPIPDADAVIVLGALVKKDHQLSSILKDRLDTAFDIHMKKPRIKIIVSGDRQNPSYDEVNPMRLYLESKGVQKNMIVMDYMGVSTFETVRRARDGFGVKKAIYVTQKFHMARTLYISNRLGLKSYGVTSDRHRYKSALTNDSREFLARFKDFFKVMCWK